MFWDILYLFFRLVLGYQQQDSFNITYDYPCHVLRSGQQSESKYSSFLPCVKFHADAQLLESLLLAVFRAGSHFDVVVGLEFWAYHIDIVRVHWHI